MLFLILNKYHPTSPHLSLDVYINIKIHFRNLSLISSTVEDSTRCKNKISDDNSKTSKVHYDSVMNNLQLNCICNYLLNVHTNPVFYSFYF